MTNEPLEYRSPDVPRRHSRAGVASLLLGALCIVGLVLSLNVSVSSQSSQRAADRSEAVALAIAIALLSCPVLGAILGVVGIWSKKRKRITAVLGLCLNALVLLVLGGAVLYAAATSDWLPNQK